MFHEQDVRSRPGAPTGLRRIEQAMGTQVTVDLRGTLPTSVKHDLAEEIFAWLRRVEALFGTGRYDSQLSLLDQGLLRPGRAHPLIRAVLNDCARLNERTEGYFDIHATGRLDLSGYLKGWALQRASALLRQGRCTDHLLRAGGDVYAAGHPEPGHTWHIRVIDPFLPHATAWVVPATDLAIATSDGHARFEHIRNPWTRGPASGLASVTIAGPDLGTADAYATAAYAMGDGAHDWLAGLDDYTHALIDEEGRRFHGWLPGLTLAA